MVTMQSKFILFGIPSALAQGCVFWEHTPITLQSHDLPVPLRRLADRNTQLAERVLRAIPKVEKLVYFIVVMFADCGVSFSRMFVATYLISHVILVTGTHYQFMWYIARVFLPGRKHYCKLSALVNPANYADIITQKVMSHI